MSVKRRRDFNFVLACMALAAASTEAPLASAEDNSVEVRSLSSKASARESFDRDVDRAALSSQESAIAKLTTLLHKYTGTRQEAILLSKLAELQQQKSGILFRIAHGAASKKSKPGQPAPALVLGPYHQALQTSIGTLNLLVAKYPHYEEIGHAYYIRGKAYEELENKDAAAKDYQLLIKNFPEAEETSPAYMSLAQFAIDANNHPLAITYLKELEKRPEDPHYPFALYKLAWSYYNLKNIPAALSYAEKQIAWYNEHFPKNSKDKGDSGTNVLSSDAAIRENTLLDVPVFYFQATEDKDDRYPASKALAYFRKLDDGPILGRMATRYAKLIRTRDMEPELIAWKNQFLTEEPKRPEGLDIVMITYEYLQNHQDYVKVEGSVQDIVRLYKSGLKFENLGKAQKMVLDTAESLQALIVRNKETEKAAALSRTLIHIYDSFTQIVDDKDPRVPQVHYNLAETLFAIKDFEGATTHYRWVVEHSTSQNKEVAKGVADSGIKAIASRYEVLHAKGLVAQDVKAAPLPSDNSGKPTIDPLISSWIEWIDAEAEHRKPPSDGKLGPRDKEFENFVFEANRSLYARGQIREAAKRLEKFATDRPSSEYAIPSASLLIDTYLASKDWDHSFDLAHSFMKVKEWQKTAFEKRLFEVSADSLYKKIEAKYALADKSGDEKDRGKLLSSTLIDIDVFLKDYGTSARVPDALSLAGAAALSAGDKDRAVAYFGKLIDASKGDGKNPARVSDALLARAAIEEEIYVFVAAADDYRSFLNMGGAKLDSSKLDLMRRKTLALSYLSGDPRQLKESLGSKTICTEALADECDKYRALWAIGQALSLTDPTISEDETDKTFDRFRKMSNSQARTLWAAYTLLGSKHLAFRDRNLTLRTVGAGYADLDATSKLALVPLLSSEVAKTFKMNRIAMKDVAPLRADEKYITHRVDMIREMENAATKAMELPWAKIRAEILNETAGLYLDLAKGLSDLPAPKGMSDAEGKAYVDTIRHITVPFEEKGEDIRSKAFDIASNGAIEDEAFQSIAEPFFTENPSQAKKLRSGTEGIVPQTLRPEGLSYIPLGLAYAPEIQSAFAAEREQQMKALKDDHARDEMRKQSRVATTIYSAWLKALQEKKWAQVAFFLQEAREKKVYSDEALSMLKAVSLAQAGARGEAIAELEDVRKNLPKDLKAHVTLTMAQNYAQSFASKKAKSLYVELTPPATSTAVAQDKPGKAPDRSPASKSGS